MRKQWDRRERERIARELLRHALLEIRRYAARPNDIDDPLDQIHMIADVCHNLPGSLTARPAKQAVDRFDPFVYLWQTADNRKRQWLVRQFEALGVDYTYLREAPQWPPPATAPDRRPRLRRRGWQLPRHPNEFTSVNTTILRKLILAAGAAEPPGRERSNWLLAHLHPDGPHVIRPSRTGEPLFLPDGPGDLRQYRGLLRMADDATVVGHIRLRATSVANLPAGLGVGVRLLLAATPTRPHERDLYLWGRDHQATDPACPQCGSLPGPNA